MASETLQNSGMEKEQKAEKWLEFVAESHGEDKMRFMITR